MNRHAVIQVSFPPSMTVEEVVDWLCDWSPPDTRLHIPMAWRDVLTPHEWVLRTGHFPTFSVDREAFATIGDTVTVFQHRKETP